MNTVEVIVAPPETFIQVIIFSFKLLSSHRGQAFITITKKAVDAIREQVIGLHKKNVHAHGLKEIPHSYIEENYKTELTKGVNHFILNHFIIDHLIAEIIERKIPATNHPRLIAITTNSQHDVSFVFDVSLSDQIDIREWKNFSFKAPKRKNYKDLDKQVSLFLRDQCDILQIEKQEVAEHNDWVCFKTHLVDVNKKAILDNCKNIFWLKIQIKAIDQPLFNLFLGKKVGDSFFTNDLSFAKESEHTMCDKLSFEIHIEAIVKGSQFALEPFKSMFKLKNKVEVHEKLIEVFSYRNDLSQRKAIIEEMFHLFFSKHRFEVPKHLVLRKQEEILNGIKKRPDYQVYKMQKNFLDQVALLAEKQLKEEILIDQIAGNENIKIDLKDMHGYLNLFSNERLKEFVYFKPFVSSLEEMQIPIHSSILKQVCRREKTLNLVLHHLTH